MIEKSVWLACSRMEAFRLFTEAISQWWPASHRLSKLPDGELFLLPGGRFFERAGGREFEMGRVREWAPPERIVLDFYLGTGPDHPTSVTIEFREEESGTRVEVRHAPSESSAALWNLRVTAFEKSWPAILVLLREHLERSR